MKLLDACEQILALDKEATSAPWIAEPKRNLVWAKNAYNKNNAELVLVAADYGPNKENTRLIPFYRNHAPKLAACLKEILERHSGCDYECGTLEILEKYKAQS